MAAPLKIKGFDKVLSNLNKEINGMKLRSARGLMESAAFIRRDMEKTPPLIPLDTGNLRASWFITRFRMLKGIGLIMGFSANYALVVHERMEGAPWGDTVVGDVAWKRPGSGPKFFEAALKRNHKEILNILQRNTRIK